MSCVPGVCVHIKPFPPAGPCVVLTGVVSNSTWSFSPSHTHWSGSFLEQSFCSSSQWPLCCGSILCSSAVSSAWLVALGNKTPSSLRGFLKDMHLQKLYLSGPSCCSEGTKQHVKVHLCSGVQLIPDRLCWVATSLLRKIDYLIQHSITVLLGQTALTQSTVIILFKSAWLSCFNQTRWCVIIRCLQPCCFSLNPSKIANSQIYTAVLMSSAYF